MEDMNYVYIGLLVLFIVFAGYGCELEKKTKIQTELITMCIKDQTKPWCRDILK